MITPPSLESAPSEPRAIPLSNLIGVTAPMIDHVVAPSTEVWRCPNEVLRRLFPSHSIHSLIDFLTASPHNRFTKVELLQPTDSATYRRLLEQTIVIELQPVAIEYATTEEMKSVGTNKSGARSSTGVNSHSNQPYDQISLSHWLYVPPCPTAKERSKSHQLHMPNAISSTSTSSIPLSESSSDGMRNLILHTISRLMSKGPNISILCQGYVKLDNHRHRSGIGDLYIHNVDTNTIVTYLQTEPWCQLLERTSDELIQWLITYTAMFAELENKCVVQLTGPAIVKLNKSINLAKAQKVTLSKSTKPSTQNITLTVAPTQPPTTILHPTLPNLVRSHSTPTTAAVSTNLNQLHPLSRVVSNQQAFPFPSTPTANLPTRSSRPRTTLPKFVPLITSLPRSTMFYRAPIKHEVGLPTTRELRVFGSRDCENLACLSLSDSMLSLLLRPHPCVCLDPFHHCRPSKRGAQRLICHIYQIATITAASPFATTNANPIQLLTRPSVDQPSKPKTIDTGTTSTLPKINDNDVPLEDDAALELFLTPIELDPTISTTMDAAPLQLSLTPVEPFSSISAAVPPPPPKKKRIRVKSDARKGKRRLKLLASGERAAVAIEDEVDDAEERKEQPVPPMPLKTTTVDTNGAAAATLSNPATATPPIPPPILPISSLPPRLRPLIPLMALLLKRHHRCYYGRWLQECCPWRLPYGAALPKSIAPSTAKRPEPTAAVEPTSLSCHISPPIVPIEVEDDGGVQPMSIDDEVPTPGPLPKQPITLQQPLTPALPSHLSSPSISPIKSLPPPNRHSDSFTPVSQIRHSNQTSGASRSSMDQSSDSTSRRYLTQAFDDDDEMDEKIVIPPAPMESTAVHSRDSSFLPSANSPMSVSQPFQPPSFGPATPAPVSQVSKPSAHSTPTDQSGIRLIQQLQESSTSIRSAVSQQYSYSSMDIQQVSVACGQSVTHTHSQTTKSSIVNTSNDSSTNTSRLSKSQQRRLKWRERLKKKHGLSRERLERARSWSSKQTQTPSRRAQAIYAAAATASKPFLPLAQLPVDTLIHMAASSFAVFSFIQRIILHVLPLGLFGSVSNRNCFLRNVRYFIRLRRFETMTGQQLMQGMKLSDVPWLRFKRTKNSTAPPSDQHDSTANPNNPAHSSIPFERHIPPTTPSRSAPRPSNKRKLPSASNEASIPTVADVTRPAVHASKLKGKKRRGKNRRGVRPPHKLTVPTTTTNETILMETGATIVAPLTNAIDGNPSATNDPLRKRPKLNATKKKSISKKSTVRPVSNSNSSHSHRPPSHHLAQIRLFSTLLRFLMTDFVLPLLRTNFYCTDSESTKHRVLYYRREIWNELVRKSMADLSGGGEDTTGHSGVNGDRAMFVRMDKVAAINYLQIRLKDITSTTNLPMPPLPASATNQPNGAALDMPSSDPLTASGAPMAASTSSSTVAGHGLGIAKLRLRPRKNGTMRPIVNMARGGQIKFPSQLPNQSQENGMKPPLMYPPINTILRHLFEVLRYEKDDSQLPSSPAAMAIAAYLAAPTPAAANGGAMSVLSAVPSTSVGSSSSNPIKVKKSNNIMGCSVFGINAIYTRILTFAQMWKSAKPMGDTSQPTSIEHIKSSNCKRHNKPSPSPRPPLYAVCVDVKHCFDTINRVKLLSILSSLLSERAYSLGRYTSLLPLFGVIRPKFLRSVSPASNIPMFIHECLRRSTTQRHAVYTDSVQRRFLDAPGLLSTLHEHIYQNIVKLGSSYYHQTDGIPQGSVLSSLLCCIYLAHMEKKAILPYLIKAANDEVKRMKTHANHARIQQRSQSIQVSSSVHHSSHIQSPIKASSTIVKKSGRDEESKEVYEQTSLNQTHEHPPEKRPKLWNSNAPSAAVDSRPPLLSTNATSATDPPSASSSSTSSRHAFSPLHLLLRQMDDFLYITTSLSAAHKFHELMTKGFKDEYGMEVNAAKTKVWFGEEEAKLDQRRELTNQEEEPKGGHGDINTASSRVAISTNQPTITRVMPWNGYLIDIPTLAIEADYTRLRSEPSPEPERVHSKSAAGSRMMTISASSPSPSLPFPMDRSSLVDSLTVDVTRRRGVGLAKSFRRFLHPRLHPLLLSTTLHSFAHVCTNLFDNFAISTAKLLAHLSQTRYALSISSSHAVQENQWFIFRTLLDGIEYALNLVHARFRNYKIDSTASTTTSSTSSSSAANSVHHFPLSNLQFRFLALHSYFIIFQRKQTRFRLVWLMLKQLLEPKHSSWLLRFEQSPSMGKKLVKGSTVVNDEDEMIDHDHAISNSVAPSDPTSPASSSSTTWLNCLQHGMCHLLESERMKLSSTSATLGTVPKPKDFVPLVKRAVTTEPPLKNKKKRPLSSVSAIAPPSRLSHHDDLTGLEASNSKKARFETDSSKIVPQRSVPDALPIYSPQSSIPPSNIDAPQANITELAMIDSLHLPLATASSPTPNPATHPNHSSLVDCICGRPHPPDSFTRSLSSADRHQLSHLRPLLPQLELHLQAQVMPGIRF